MRDSAGGARGACNIHCNGYSTQSLRASALHRGLAGKVTVYRKLQRYTGLHNQRDMMKLLFTPQGNVKVPQTRRFKGNGAAAGQCPNTFVTSLYAHPTQIAAVITVLRSSDPAVDSEHIHAAHGLCMRDGNGKLQDVCLLLLLAATNPDEDLGSPRHPSSNNRTDRLRYCTDIRKHVGHRPVCLHGKFCKAISAPCL